MLELLIAKLGIPLEEAQRSYAGEGCERRPPPAAAEQQLPCWRALTAWWLLIA